MIIAKVSLEVADGLNYLHAVAVQSSNNQTASVFLKVILVLVFILAVVCKLKAM